MKNKPNMTVGGRAGIVAFAIQRLRADKRIQGPSLPQKDLERGEMNRAESESS